MDKTKEIQKILEIMNSKGINIDDLTAYCLEQELLKQQFDLLCEIDGVKKRLPFAKGKNLNPIGIFPFKDNVYLELAEQPNSKRCHVVEDKVPMLGLWEDIFKIKDILNDKLAELKAPQLKECYFARKEDSDANWIVGFLRYPHLAMDYYNNDVMAKIRYCGIFVATK